MTNGKNDVQNSPVSVHNVNQCTDTTCVYTLLVPLFCFANFVGKKISSHPPSQLIITAIWTTVAKKWNR